MAIVFRCSLYVNKVVLTRNDPVISVVISDTSCLVEHYVNMHILVNNIIVVK